MKPPTGKKTPGGRHTSLTAEDYQLLSVSLLNVRSLIWAIRDGVPLDAIADPTHPQPLPLIPAAERIIDEAFTAVQRARVLPKKRARGTDG